MKTLLTGLSGGIGSGKSVISGILRLRGFRVYDCDLRAREFMERSEELRTDLIKLCGEEIYNCNGCLNRTVLAERLFSKQELRAGVNRLVHSAVRNDIKRVLAEMSDSSQKELFCESAILCVSEIAEMCDRIWWVDAPEHVRIARVMKRSNMTSEQVKARMRSQQDEKVRVEESGVPLTYIDNSGDSSLLSQLDKLLETKK